MLERHSMRPFGPYHEGREIQMKPHAVRRPVNHIELVVGIYPKAEVSAPTQGLMTKIMQHINNYILFERNVETVPGPLSSEVCRA